MATSATRTLFFARRYFKRSLLIGTAVLVLGVIFMYGVGVGRYRYAPYQRIAPVLQKFPEIRTWFSDRSDQLSDESLRAEENEYERRLDRVGLSVGAADSVADLVLAAFRSFEMELDPLLGYTIGHSVVSGGTIPVYVHNVEAVSVDVYRLGRAKTKVKSLANLPENQQSPLFNGYKGFQWEPSFRLDTEDYSSGYYLIELSGLTSGNQYQIPLVVTPTETPKIALISQTNTWQAYNNYGGLGNYVDTRNNLWGKGEAGSINRAVNAELPHIQHLPYARPYTYGPGNSEEVPWTFHPPIDIDDDTRPEDRYDGHLFRSEWPMAAFAEANQLEYGVYSDEDFKVDSPVMEADVVLFNTHSEYWSQDMFNALDQYLANGGKVIFAGGNTAYREVKATEFGMRVVSQFIPSYLTTPFLGTSYTGDGFRTYGGYEVEIPDHWVFDDTDVQDGDVFGEYSANQPAPGSLGEGGVGASGFETDKVNRYSDLYADGFQTLAKGTNSQGPAYMVFKDTDAKGWIFHSASVSFSGALFHDPVIDRLMLNLFTQD